MTAKADGSVIIKAKVDVAQADKDLSKLKEKIQKTESDIEEISQKKAEAEKQSVFSAAELDAEKAKLVEMKRDLQEMRDIAKDTTLSPSMRNEAKAQIPQQQQEIADQQARVRMLQGEYDKVYNSVLRYDGQLKTAKETLDKQTEEAGELAQKINSVSKASVKMAEAQKKAEKNARKFGLRLKEVLRSALVFTVITRAAASLRDWAADVIKSNDKAKESIARLKGALLTFAQPLVELILPATVAVADALTKIVLVLANLFSIITGSTLEESKKAAEALNKEKESIEGVGKAAEDAKASLASFDEINKLGGENKKESTIGPSFDFSDEKMSENANGLAAAIAAIGTAFLTWKIADSVLGWFGDLGSGKFNNASKVSAGIAGIASAIALMEFHAGQVSAGKINPDSFKSQILKAIEATIFAIGGAALLSVCGITFGAGIIITLPIGMTLANLTIGLADEQGQAAVSNLKTIIEGIFCGEDWGSIIGNLIAGEKTEETLWSKINKVFSSQNGFGRAQIGLLETIKKFGDEKFIKTLDMSIGERISYWMSQMFPGFFDSKEGGDRAASYTEKLMDNTFAPAGFWLGRQLGERIEKWMRGQFPGLFNDSATKEDTKNSLFEFIRFVTDPLGYWLKTKLEDPIKDSVKKAWEWLSSLFEGKNWFTQGFTGFGPDYSWMFKSAPSVGSVPGLATGSVIPPNRQFLAVLGDNKTETEVVSPLSTMKQAMLEAMRESGGMGGTIVIKTYLDGRQIAENQVRHINEMSRENGSPVIVT